MTVTKVNDPNAEWPDGLIATAWFDDAGGLRRDSFPAGALVVDSGAIGSAAPR